MISSSSNHHHNKQVSDKFYWQQKWHKQLNKQQSVTGNGVGVGGVLISPAVASANSHQSVNPSVHLGEIVSDNGDYADQMRDNEQAVIEDANEDTDDVGGADHADIAPNGPKRKTKDNSIGVGMVAVYDDGDDVDDAVNDKSKGKHSNYLLCAYLFTKCKQKKLINLERARKSEREKEISMLRPF